MCGACGRTVVADPALGPVRTTRDLLVVAHLLGAVTRDVPGVPVARRSGDGWVLTGRTGSHTTCATVDELWLGLLAAVDHRSGAAAELAAEVGRLLDRGPASPLEERVLAAGLRVLTRAP